MRIGGWNCGAADLRAERRRPARPRVQFVIYLNIYVSAAVRPCRYSYQGAAWPGPGPNNHADRPGALSLSLSGPTRRELKLDE